MGFLDEIKKLTRPYDDEEDEFFDAAPAEAPVTDEPAAPERRGSFFAEPDPAAQAEAPPAAHAPRFSRREGRAQSREVSVGPTQQKLVLVTPLQFEDAAEVADQLRDGRTVVMNIEKADKATGRRLLDFLSGACYAMRGKVQKVSASIYLITPAGVSLLGEELTDEIENNALYF